MTLSRPYPTALSGPSHLVRPADTGPAGKGRRLVVFFGAKDLAEGQFNFLQLGHELPETCIFLNNGANDWYQWGIPGFGDSFTGSLDLLRRWAAAMQAEEICMIGSSMGGYAAIQYGAALGARVLAFSSDAVLAEPLSRSAAYLTGTGAPTCPDLRPVVAASGARFTLMLGERDATDIWSAHQLAQAGPVTVQSLIGMDHHVPSALSRRSRLGPLLRSFVAGQDLPVQPDAGAAVTTPGHAPALRAAQVAEAVADWAEAEAQARLALAAYPCGEAANMILGWALFRQNRFAEAIAALSTALVSQPADGETALRLAGALRRGGAAVQARQLLLQILARDPGAHRAHYALSLTQSQLGQTQAARQSLQRALRILPRHQPYLDRLKALPAEQG